MYAHLRSANAVTLTAALFGYGTLASAVESKIDACLLSQVRSADSATTVAELRAACASFDTSSTTYPGAQSDDTGESIIDIRRRADREARAARFVMSTHRPNYIMATNNDSPNEAPFGDEEGFLDEEEIKFQVSFKMPVATELFGGNTDLMFGYTSVSWWQLFNDEIDNPFRETNYEPEVFLSNHSDRAFLGMDVISLDFGVNHQSNGQSGTLSRGWDRAFGSAAVQLSDDVVLGGRLWHVLRRQDTNPDLYRYMGYGEIGLGWAPNRNTFTLLYRPAIEGDAVQATWSYPISKYLRVYAQYWNGYGESLIDYNVRTERFGIGVALSDIVSRD